LLLASIVVDLFWVFKEKKWGTEVVQGRFLQHMSVMLVWFQLNLLLIFLIDAQD
jgi:hypothetical protein